MHELEVLKTIEKQDDINGLPILYDTFEVEGPRGSHLCFLTNLLSSDVSSFRRNAPNKALKPYIVKNIIGQVLEALVQLHSLDIIHTGVDNGAWNVILQNLLILFVLWSLRYQRRQYPFQLDRRSHRRNRKNSHCRSSQICLRRWGEVSHTCLTAHPSQTDMGYTSSLRWTDDVHINRFRSRSITISSTYSFF